MPDEPLALVLPELLPEPVLPGLQAARPRAAASAVAMVAVLVRRFIAASDPGLDAWLGLRWVCYSGSTKPTTLTSAASPPANFHGNAQICALRPVSLVALELRFSTIGML